MPGVEIAALGTDHLPALARLQLEIFPVSEGKLLGYDYALHFVDWFRRSPDAVAIVAMADGLPVGYALCAPEPKLPELYRSLLPVVLRRVLARPWIAANAEVRQMAAQRLRLVLRRTARERSADLACLRLRTLGVRPEWRRRGVASALVDTFLRAAARRGFRRVTASTRRTNEAARAFYERRGWCRSDAGEGDFVDYGVTVEVPEPDSTPAVASPSTKR